MIEYAVNLKIGSTPDLALVSTVTSNINIAKEHLERANREIRAGKYPVHTTAKLVMHEVTPWCEVNMKTIDCKWDGKAVHKGG